MGIIYDMYNNFKNKRDVIIKELETMSKKEAILINFLKLEHIKR